MPDYICPSCGQKALQVATRCPRCGLAIETQFMQHQASAPKRGRLRLVIVVAAAVVVIVLASRFEQPRPSPSGPQVRLPAAVVVDSATERTPSAVTDSVSVAIDSTPAVPQPAVPAESSKGPGDSTSPTVPSPALAPDSVMPPGAVRRYAGTWINVRSGRNNRAPVIRILHPGDPVVVDSLVRGWYRVIARGEAVGYLDRRLLDTIPSATRP